MIHFELQLIGALRALAEIAGMFLLARGALFLLAAGRHRQNVVYQLFCIITRPVIAATRRVVPVAIGDRFVPAVAFVLLFALWIALACLRLRVCGPEACG